jgi:hypothetical protein
MSQERSVDRRRAGAGVLAGIARGLGALGVLGGVALAVLVLVGRGRASERVGEIAATIDGGLAQGLLPLASARERVGGIEALVDGVGDAVRQRAADSEVVAGAREALLAKAAALSDRYLALRSTYAEGRERLVAALERLHTLDRSLPAVSIPAGPVAALAALDQEVRSLDRRILDLLAAVAAEGQLAEGLAAQVDAIRGTFGRVGIGLEGARTRIEALRAEVAHAADRVHRLLTIAAAALALLLLYGAFLHAVLYRHAARGGRSAPQALATG